MSDPLIIRVPFSCFSIFLREPCQQKGQKGTTQEPRARYRELRDMRIHPLEKNSSWMSFGTGPFSGAP